MLLGECDEINSKLVLYQRIASLARILPVHFEGLLLREEGKIVSYRSLEKAVIVLHRRSVLSVRWSSEIHERAPL